VGAKRGTRPRKSHKHDSKFKPVTGNPLIEGMLTPHGRYLPPGSYAKQIAGGIASSQHFEPKLPLSFNNHVRALEHSTHSTLYLLPHDVNASDAVGMKGTAMAFTALKADCCVLLSVDGFWSCSIHATPAQLHLTVRRHL
jgi:hypothetical protein